MRRAGYILALLVLLAVLGSPAAGAAFSDVDPESWYGEAVAELTGRGLLTGCPDGSFQPERPISAAEFVTIAVRCGGLAPASGQSGHWAAGELRAALEAGWYDWDELPPTGEGFDRPISRQLAVKILMRALLPEVRGDYQRESAKISDFSTLSGRYYEPVLAAYAAGVVTGDGNGAFRPLDGLSWAEACVLLRRALQKAGGERPSPPAVPKPAAPLSGGVSQTGWLQVKGTQLCGESGEPVVLRGMSSHGLQWFGSFAGVQAVRQTAAAGANVFRVAMYTGEGGYLSQPEAMKERVIAAVDAAIACDMYVIIDWHILSDGDPLAHGSEAEAFFSEMAQRYGDTPNVLYEICNEPNGGITWQGNVKPYAQRVIAAIREHAPRGIILVGSPTWSQDIHLAAADPLQGENLMYTLRFYAGTHGAELRERIDAARKGGLPVFVSEWGTSRANGGGGVFLEEAGVWLDFLEERAISWCNWSLCDKDEASAALRPGTAPGGTWSEADLTPSGRFVFSRLAH